MPDWYREAALLLEKIGSKDLELFKNILLAIKRIQRNPTLGTISLKTYRVYYDEEGRFRIGYNYYPKAKEPIVIISLYIPKKI